jgi:hypothetical protein
MHLNNVTVAEVETVGCWSTKLPIISPRLKRGKNTPRSTLPFRRALAGRYGISCIANVLVAVVFPSY